MKQLSILLAVILLLCGCVAPAATAPETTQTQTMAPETTAPVTTVPEAQEPEVTQPEHSPFYIEGVAVEDVILWFNEVCLDSEIYHSGDPSVVQKWTEPIRYSVKGDPTPEDLTVLEGFTQWLNTVKGFPGIARAQPEEWVNLRINFVDAQNLEWIMGPDYSGLDGALTFWYDDDNSIYDCVICVRSDVHQYLRNSVILEELYNGLGPVQDTQLRSDSIIYQQYAEPQSLTEADKLILKLLYHPDMERGMNAEACEAVIRSLYY